MMAVQSEAFFRHMAINELGAEGKLDGSFGDWNAQRDNN